MLLSQPAAIGLDIDDIQGMLYGMRHLGTNLHQSSPLQRIGNNSIARQPRLQQLDLKLKEADLSIASGRPGLLEQHAIVRVAGRDTPIPYSPVLEKIAVPGKDEIIKAVKGIFEN